MKIVPALWPGRRKALKIGPIAEASIWAAAAGLAVALALSGSPLPAAARRQAIAAAQPALTAPQPELATSSYRRACLRRVIDLNRTRTEVEIIDQLNAQCFALRSVAAPDVQPAGCIEAFSWVPGLAAAGPPGSCYRQSRAGSRPQ
ncbi:MAG TPA: hypothetical protein VIN00_03255 [Candidatus Dormibacteraeota bacterium]|jgi:hypothetical protein